MGVAGGSSLVLILVLFGLLLAVVWIILPFAIFGTKPLLTELIRQQRMTNDLLVDIRDQRKP
jgi:hypothetical protein